MLKDLLYAPRTLAQSPGFAAVAVVTLAIGIAANTAVFSLVDALLWKPFPFTEPERLLLVQGTIPEQGVEYANLSYPNYQDIREQTKGVFEDLAVWDWEPYNLTDGSEPVRVGGARVSGNLFSVLGVEPILGRGFLPEEDRPGGARVVVLSYELWQSYFGGRHDILDATVRLNAMPYTVIGVMAPGVQMPSDARLWVLAVHEGSGVEDRSSAFLTGLGRLAPGVDRQRAAAALAAVASRLEARYPEANRGRGARVESLEEWRLPAAARQISLILLAMVGFVLLLAATNIANLMLARGTVRERELATRAALGAGRAHLIGPLLGEALLLAAAGGLCGLLLGWGGLRLMVGSIPFPLPPWMRFELDSKALAFTTAATFLAALLFGLLPAWRASRVEAGATLGGDGGRGATGGRGLRLRRALVVGQVAVALLLLVGGGLTIRSFTRLAAVEPGFEAPGALAVGLDLPVGKYGDDERRRSFVERVVERVEALPGVDSAAIVSWRLPLTGGQSATTFALEGQTPEAAEKNPFAIYHAVTPHYFRAMGIPLLAGRSFTAADGPGAPPVIVLDRALAERLWPGGNALGRRLRADEREGPESGEVWSTVVGVVGTVHHQDMTEEPQPAIYAPYAQDPWARNGMVVRASGGDPAALAPLLRAEMRALDPDQPLYDLRPMATVVDLAIWQWRFFTVLFWLFAATALALAAVGVYGTVAYAAARRTREIGIRMALGANQPAVLRLMLRQGLTTVAVGLALGMPAALGLAHLLAGTLFGVKAGEPGVFAATLLLLATVAAAASLVPAIRAARLDPLDALRHD